MLKKDLNKVIYIVAPALSYSVLSMVGFSSWLIGDSYPNVSINGEAGEIEDNRLKFKYSTMVNSMIFFDSYYLDSDGSVTSSIDSNEQLEIQLKGVLDGYETNEWSLLRFNIRIEPKYRTAYNELIDLGYIVEPKFNDLFKDDTRVSSIISTYGSYWTSSIADNSRTFTIKYSYSWGALFNNQNPSLFFDSEYFNGIKKGNEHTYKEKKEIINKLGTINGAKYSIYLDSVDLNTTNRIIFNSNGGSFSTVDNSTTLTIDSLINHDKIRMPACYKDSFKFTGRSIGSKVYKENEEVYIDELFDGISGNEITINATFEDLRTSGNIVILSGGNYGDASISLYVISSKYGASSTTISSSTSITNILIGDKILLTNKKNVKGITYSGLSTPNADGWQTVTSSSFTLTITPLEKVSASFIYTNPVNGGTRLANDYFKFRIEYSDGTQFDKDGYIESESFGIGQKIKLIEIHGLESYSISGATLQSDGYYLLENVSITINIVCKPSYNLTFNQAGGDKTPTINYTIKNSNNLIHESTNVGMGIIQNCIIKGDIVSVTSNSNVESISPTTATVNDSNVTFNVTASSCLTENTLVLLENLTYIKAINLKSGDMVMTLNHETGNFQAAPVVFNDDYDKEPEDYNVIILDFSNGKSIEIVYEHGFFDLNTMKNEYITEGNYKSFIGHRFVYIECIDYKMVKMETLLKNAYIKKKHTRICSPVTYKNLNIITEGMLSMPGGIEGIFNIFDYNDDLSFNSKKKENDIKKYGLFDYSYFKDKIPYEFYEAFNGKYLKVALGKRILTEDMIDYYINRYLPVVNKQNI